MVSFVNESFKTTTKLKLLPKHCPGSLTSPCLPKAPISPPPRWSSLILPLGRKTRCLPSPFYSIYLFHFSLKNEWSLERWVGLVWDLTPTAESYFKGSLPHAKSNPVMYLAPRWMHFHFTTWEWSYFSHVDRLLTGQAFNASCDDLHFCSLPLLFWSWWFLCGPCPWVAAVGKFPEFDLHRQEVSHGNYLSFC